MFICTEQIKFGFLFTFMQKQRNGNKLQIFHLKEIRNYVFSTNNEQDNNSFYRFFVLALTKVCLVICKG